MIPNWVIEAADAFWSAVGERESFPRNLRTPIATILPVAVVTLPRLRLRGVGEWLRRQDIVCGLGEHDRSLRACLIARRGQGLIFLDGSDPPDEQRFSLAHEAAHFIRDYWQSRHRAIERLGPAALEVLDGDRLPEPSERIDAVLSHVELSYHVHLLERTQDGEVANRVIAIAERSADLLACQLLAPADHVLQDVPAMPSDALCEFIARRLADEFGLPTFQARAYAARLAPVPASDSLIHRLGLAR
jgi:hypothetical protein